jgi:dihydroorotate dehydrogenase
MSLCEVTAKADKIFRPLMNSFAPEYAIKMYSCSRKLFIKALTNEPIDSRAEIPESFRTKLWDIDFYSPIINAAGMFKNGEGYKTAYYQGAGAYLCGTVTPSARIGNNKDGVKHPFLSYPKSASASNWMGLPNIGAEALAKKVSKIEKKKFCPIGVSVSKDPESNGDEAIENFIESLKMFDLAGADFIEINESCPNVEHDFEIDENTGLDNALINRLEIISEKFLKKINRKLPLIVKFSNDTNVRLAPKIIDILVDLGFDGANFGNTSTDYDYLRQRINPVDLKAFDLFISKFGGGVSGRALKQKSGQLALSSINRLKEIELKKEFHIIRTGGVETADDVMESIRCGVSLCQWFTGYFEAFANDGHNLYRNMFASVK